MSLQVPSNANHVELQIFLKDKLHQLGILAFEIKKFRGQQNNRHFATLTVSNTTKGNNFLQLYGSRGRAPALCPLYFRGENLKFSKSNRPGQPEPLKVRTLQEKEETMRAKMQGPTTVAQPRRSNQPTLAFQSLRTGIWDYDAAGELAFDPKFKDLRSGYVTFGSAAIVVYLQQITYQPFDWHGRVDIPHAIIEHVIPSINSRGRASILLTLKSPPKFYKISSTDDLHLYAGVEAPCATGGLPDLASLTLNNRTKANRLERLCSLSAKHRKSAALCMVYSLEFPDVRTAQHAHQHLKDFSVSDAYCWKLMTFNDTIQTIESEFEVAETKLCDYGPSIPLSFDFPVRFQLTGLLLEGYITPRKVFDLIFIVHGLTREYGSGLTASALRHLARSVSIASPSTEAKHFKIVTFLKLLKDHIQNSREHEVAGHDLGRKQKQHHHLALTYKATVTPTGEFL